MTEEPETAELKKVQAERETDERALAEHALDETEAAAHERRAERARYLQEKLEERAKSERER